MYNRYFEMFQILKYFELFLIVLVFLWPVLQIDGLAHLFHEAFIINWVRLNFIVEFLCCFVRGFVRLRIVDLRSRSLGELVSVIQDKYYYP